MVRLVMHKKYLRHYLQHILHDLKQNYLGIQKRANERNVHDFRVAVKKINALFDLLAFLAPGKLTPNSQIDQIKNLYKLLGRIRDAHIGGMLCEVYLRQLDHLEDDLLPLIQKKEKTARKRFSDWKKETEITLSPSRVEEDLRPFFRIDNKTLIHNCDQFAHRQFRNIWQHLHTQQSDKWHKVRMESKSIRYTLELGQKLSPNSGREEVLDKMRLIGDLLGDWHDRIILSGIVRDFSKTPDKEGINSMIKKLKKDRSVLLETTHLYLRELQTKQYFWKMD